MNQSRPAYLVTTAAPSACMCASVQAELDALFGVLRHSGVRTRAVSAQAFSKARRGLSAELFELARARLISLVQSHIDSMRRHGLRLIAADGTRLRMGTRRGHELRADHYAVAQFLPGSELTLHALHPTDGAGRQMLFEALDVLQPRTDLLLLDRGYIGNAMVAALTQRDIPFCMRVDTRNWKCVSALARRGEAERVVTLAAPHEQDARDYELALAGRGSDQTSQAPAAAGGSHRPRLPAIAAGLRRQNPR